MCMGKRNVIPSYCLCDRIFWLRMVFPLIMCQWLRNKNSRQLFWGRVTHYLIGSISVMKLTSQLQNDLFTYYALYLALNNYYIIFACADNCICSLVQLCTSTSFLYIYVMCIYFQAYIHPPIPLFSLLYIPGPTFPLPLSPSHLEWRGQGNSRVIKEKVKEFSLMCRGFHGTMYALQTS